VFRPRTEFELLREHEECCLEWVNAFPPHTTHRTDEPGYACLVAGPDPVAEESAKEAVYRGAAGFLAELFPKLPPQSTVGVLARTNVAVGRIVHELRRQGLPASEEGGNPLNDSAAVQIVLSAMQLADHPGDSIALFHVKHSPLGPLLDLPRDATPEQAAAAGEHIRRALQTRGYGAVVADWAAGLTGHCNARELDRLRQLTALADEYEGIATLRPSEFARYVEARGVEDPRTARIRVITVHKAKGLEFDVVLLPQLDEQLFKPPKFVAYREQGAEAVEASAGIATRRCSGCPPDIRAAFQQTSDRAVRERERILRVADPRRAGAVHVCPAGRAGHADIRGHPPPCARPSGNAVYGRSGAVRVRRSRLARACRARPAARRRCRRVATVAATAAAASARRHAAPWTRVAGAVATEVATQFVD
jgi:superfamily I DNA/RNA helicase